MGREKMGRILDPAEKVSRTMPLPRLRLIQVAGSLPPTQECQPLPSAEIRSRNRRLPPMSTPRNLQQKNLTLEGDVSFARRIGGRGIAGLGRGTVIILALDAILTGTSPLELIHQATPTSETVGPV